MDDPNRPQQPHQPMDQPDQPDQAVDPHPPDHSDRRRSRARAITIAIGGVVLLALGVLFLVNSGAPPAPPVNPTVDAGQVASDWNTLDFEPEPEQPVARKTVNMKGDGDDVYLIVHTFEQICWNGYIVEEPIEGCGRAVLTLRNAPRTLGLNVTSQSRAKVFLGVAVLDATSENPLESLETDKARATLAATVSNV